MAGIQIGRGDGNEERRLWTLILSLMNLLSTAAITHLLEDVTYQDEGSG